jgi:hypothetical protein
LAITEVNVTGVPAQIVLDDAATVMEGGVMGLMIIVTPLLVAKGIVAQGELEVNIQAMMSPLVNVLSV